jgi:hypothetical protein
MKIGDLVKTNRFSVGVPEGSLGLIVDAKNLGWTEEIPFVIDFFKEDKYGIKRYIYFKEDLEVVSESR